MLSVDEFCMLLLPNDDMIKCFCLELSIELEIFLDQDKVAELAAEEQALIFSDCDDIFDEEICL